MIKVRAIVVGTGGFAQYHIRAMIGMKRSTAIVGMVEPAASSREATASIFAEKKLRCPPFFNSIAELLRARIKADCALICSPHKFHFENARDCLEAGMDVLLEKPMVINAGEARRLIALRDKTRRLLMVAFPGSLSPAIWKAKEMIGKGVIGEVNAVSAHVYQEWKKKTIGKWRQVPEISGGGFLFDTGSHMINTVVDLLGSDVAQVSAMLDNRGTPVEINSSVSGISASGVTFSLTGAGDCVHCCSQIMVFGSTGVIRTGVWGETLAVKKAGEQDFTPVPYRKSSGPWEQFLRVRSGKMTNPCPAEVGLRFAKLMDMIRTSAQTGMVVRAARRRPCP